LWNRHRLSRLARSLKLSTRRTVHTWVLGFETITTSRRVLDGVPGIRNGIPG
jgi:hypothetical protein